MSNYKSPIKVFEHESLCYEDVFQCLGEKTVNNFAKTVANDFDNMVFDKTKTEIKKNIGLDIDFDELRKALEYDRNQYEQGFCDGKIARDSEIIRCKDCIHYKPETYSCINKWYMEPDDFCSYAEDKSALEY